MLPKDGQQFNGKITEESMAFGSVPAAYDTLKNFGTNSIFNHFVVINTLDNPITLKFVTGESEIVLAANESFVYDNMVFNGIVQIKHNGAAPTSGAIKVRGW